MFRTLKYVWKLLWENPSKRRFLIFVKMLRTEILCLFMTGYSTDELLKQSGGLIGRVTAEMDVGTGSSPVLTTN